jgi:hypothetical protein
MVERARIPLGFRQIQAANLVGWRGELDHPGLAMLRSAVERSAGAPLLPHPEPLARALSVTPVRPTVSRPRPVANAARSLLALAAGIIAALGTAFLLGITSFYIELEFSGGEAWPVVLALIYIALGQLLAGWVTARIAPTRPMLHAFGVGAILALLNVLFMATTSLWTEILIVLAIAEIPCAWIGGYFSQRQTVRNGSVLPALLP